MNRFEFESLSDAFDLAVCADIWNGVVPFNDSECALINGAWWSVEMAELWDLQHAPKPRD